MADAVDFPESNSVLRGEGSVEDLPVLRRRWEAGPAIMGGEIISKWRLTWRERLQLIFYGNIWLRVLHPVHHPPVWIQGGRRVPEECQPE